jgi:hypothetical protein
LGGQGVRKLIFFIVTFLGLGQGSNPGSVEFSLEIPETAWVEVFMPSIEKIEECGKFSNLKSQIDDKKLFEVRVWIGWGIGQPYQLYLVKSEGEKITGSQYIWWESDSWRYRRSVTQLVKKEYGCSSRIFRCGEARFCENLSSNSKKFEDIFKYMDKNGIWDLPDSTTLPPVNFTIFDSDSIILELRTPNSYRAIEYDYKLSSYPWPEASKLKSFILEITSIFN